MLVYLFETDDMLRSKRTIPGSLMYHTARYAHGMTRDTPLLAKIELYQKKNTRKQNIKRKKTRAERIRITRL